MIDTLDKTDPELQDDVLSELSYERVSEKLGKTTKG